MEIIKAGVARFFPEPERLLLEKLGPRFAPDLVLVGFTPNDLIDTCLGLEAITVDESGFLMSRDARMLGPVGLHLYLHSAFARLLLSKLVVNRSMRARGWPSSTSRSAAPGARRRATRSGACGNGRRPTARSSSTPCPNSARIRSPRHCITRRTGTARRRATRWWPMPWPLHCRRG
ncbi:MAG: hypothetical protein FJ197_08885 [Gammaproteobacteria bacterium]|nr:hypothetical protein [Gammaproteobacteria bacterium]